MAHAVEYLWLPAVAANYASTPDTAVLDITGDIDIRARIRPRLWNVGTPTALVSKFAASNQSYSLLLATTGNMLLQFSLDGTALESATSGILMNTVLEDGEIAELRVTRASVSGLCNFYWRREDTDPWIQIGAPDIASTTGSLFSGTAPLEIGTQSVGTTNLFGGGIYTASVRSGIDGTPVFDADFTKLTAKQVLGQSFPEDANNLDVTLNGAAWTYVRPLVPTSVVGVKLPRVAAQSLFTPDQALYDIPGAIDVRCQIAPDDWSPALSEILFAKRGASGQRSWELISIAGSGRLRFGFYEDGINVINLTSDGPILGFPDGSTHWVRATFNPGGGAGGVAQVQFFTGDDGINWTQLGGSIDNTGGSTPAVISTSTADLEIGIYNNNNTSQKFVGTYYKAQYLNGIDGTVVFDWDGTDLDTYDHPSKTFIDKANGAVVTVRGLNAIPQTQPILTRAIMLYQANDGNEGGTPKWSDRSGSDLHAQIGSADGPDTNDPTFYDLENGRQYFRSAGLAINRCESPGSLNPQTGNVWELIQKIRAVDYTPGVSAAPHGAASGRLQLIINPTGTLSLSLRVDHADTTNTGTSTVATGATDETDLWIRATYNWVTNVFNFYTSTDATFDPSTVVWVQLGAADVIGSGVNGPYNKFSVYGPLILGLGNNTSIAPYDGRIYSSQMVIDAAVFYELDFNLWDVVASSLTFTDAAGVLWTITQDGTAEVSRIVDRAHWWFDTDDQHIVANTPAFEFADPESFSVITGVRTYNNDGLTHMLMTIRTAISTAAVGWSIQLHTTDVIRLDTSDGVVEAFGLSAATVVEGQAHVAGGVRDAPSIEVTAFLDAAGGTPGVLETTGDLFVGTTDLIFGSSPTASLPLAGEITDGAVFRQALTDAEMQDVVNEIIGGGGVPGIGSFLLMGVG